MCTAIALAAGSAAVSTVGGVMQAKAQHRAGQEAAARQNLINDLNYKKQLQISSIKDQEKGEAFSRQLAANAAARTTLYRQMALNNMERVRASILDNGNTQLRAALNEISNYTINWERYTIDLPLKENKKEN